jgi:hypothetical protein
VKKVSPFALYVDLFEDKIQAKLPIEKNDQPEYKQGDKIEVVITHLTPSRIVVKQNNNQP